MKRFRFSLETLLSLKREQEQEAEIALAKAVGQLNLINKQIEEARGHGEQAFSVEASSLAALQIREARWRKSVQDLKNLEEPRRNAESRAASARAVYTEARSQTAAIEKLREKKHEQWRKASLREEIDRLDETAKGAAVRSRLTGGIE